MIPGSATAAGVVLPPCTIADRRSGRLTDGERALLAAVGVAGEVAVVLVCPRLADGELELAALAGHDPVRPGNVAAVLALHDEGVGAVAITRVLERDDDHARLGGEDGRLEEEVA